ncbi:MAG TPA: adenylate/guanylate cyclase domain-containing protein [Thermoleophilaceae bacterium]|jgi:class 3 adenylate cyclase
MGPSARYAKSGDVHIAYVIEGDAPMDLVWVPTWISQCEHLFTEPTLEAVGERIGRFARVITFDRRGSGLSDPMIGAPTLEEQMDDVLAVMDAAGCERATIFGTLEGGPLAALFAATYPDRVNSLILYATFARASRAEGYDWTWTKEERAAAMSQLVANWGQGLTAGGIAPSRMNDPQFVEWAARMERLAASPATIAKIMDLIGEFDVRHVLPSIRVPTLVLHRRDDNFIDFRHGQYIAEHVPNARLVELDGSDNLFTVGDVDSFLGEVEEFLTGSRFVKEPDRMLATVLFTDICDSTKRAAELGDADWRKLLEQHDRLVRRALERHRGREIKSTGDGFLATFDGPARALRCAASISEGVRTLGIEVRAGLHTGEVEVMNGDIGGLAVHIGARVMGAAGPSEVLVSSTVKDLVVGSGIEFAERGSHELKGVPGEWRLFAVD